MKWITCERPKIYSNYCPWLVKRFVKPKVKFTYVPKEQVFEKAPAMAAIPYHIHTAEYSHYGAECAFDYIRYKHNLADTPLHKIALRNNL